MSDTLSRLVETIAARCTADAGSSYVASLFAKGTDAICKKVAEEAAETIMAAKDGDRDHLVREVCDLWFHSLVLLVQQGGTLDEVMAEFARREGRSGLEEKASRAQTEG